MQQNEATSTPLGILASGGYELGPLIVTLEAINPYVCGLYVRGFCSGGFKSFRGRTYVKEVSIIVSWACKSLRTGGIIIMQRGCKSLHQGVINPYVRGF